MQLARLSVALLAVAALTTGCAKRGQVQTQPRFDVEGLCSDPRTQSMCTPLPSTELQRPVQVDTNMTAPALRAPVLG